jgi:alanine racemase
MNLRTFVRSIKKQFDPHEPLIEVGISRENLLHNLHTYQEKYPALQFAPVLKSNAYGHGLVVIASLLDTQQIAFFMVDSFYEARTLRQHGIRSKIVIMGYVAPQEVVGSHIRNTEYAIVSLEQLREVARTAQNPVRLHIKIDTGMHRQGIVPADIDEAIMLLKSNTNLQVVGVASHFADADNTDQTNTDAQISVWNTVSASLLATFPTISYKHIAATKGAWRNEASTGNVMRLGIGLYGIDTSPEGAADMRPVMEVRSRISSVRTVPAGDFVGYNATYTALRDMRIATIPFGYYEGLDRRLSNKGSVLLHGTECSIVGRISMNISGIEVTGVPDAKAGDVVTILSRNSDAINSAENMAELVSSSDYTETPYVILTQIPSHLKRVVE